VGHEDKRGPGVPFQFEHDRDHPLARLGAEVASRFVGEEDLGPVDEGAGERDALAVSTIGDGPTAV
jgi:hypothetical protein